MGTMPEWYLIIQAAKYLGVPVWDLLERGVAWIGYALAAMSAESSARETLARIEESKWPRPSRTYS